MDIKGCVVHVLYIYLYREFAAESWNSRLGFSALRQSKFPKRIYIRGREFINQDFGNYVNEECSSSCWINYS